MEAVIEKECSALGGLFQVVIGDMKVSGKNSPICIITYFTRRAANSKLTFSHLLGCAKLLVGDFVVVVVAAAVVFTGKHTTDRSKRYLLLLTRSRTSHSHPIMRGQRGSATLCLNDVILSDSLVSPSEFVLPQVGSPTGKVCLIRYLIDSLNALSWGKPCASASSSSTRSTFSMWQTRTSYFVSLSVSQFRQLVDPPAVGLTLRHPGNVAVRVENYSESQKALTCAGQMAGPRRSSGVRKFVMNTAQPFSTSLSHVPLHGLVHRPAVPSAVR